MVRGLDIFREFFSGMEKNYIIIGGTACNIHEEAMQQEPRATKDIDMILIVEALSDSFVRRFWEFISAGGYMQRQRGESINDEKKGRSHEYFRFIKPENKDFPKQIELFSRNIGILNAPEDAHITPIPAGEDLSSLSAILMDDDYYNFTSPKMRTDLSLFLDTIEKELPGKELFKAMKLPRLNAEELVEKIRKIFQL